MKTYTATPSDIVKKWYLVDAENLVLGRLAVLIADTLRGKHKTTYTPHMDCGDNVVVINAEKVHLTGRKREKKQYHRHTGYAGGIKTTTPAKLLESAHANRVIELAVKRMLPAGPLGRQQMSNLRVYAGAQHPHEAQSPVKLDIAAMNAKNARRIAQ